MSEPSTYIKWSVDHEDEVNVYMIGIETAIDPSRMAGIWLMDEVMQPIREIRYFVMPLPKYPVLADSMTTLARGEVSQ